VADALDPCTEAAPVIVERPLVEDLGLVPDHASIPEIERWVFPGTPGLVSVHRVTDAEPVARDYCAVHAHDDMDEVNLVIGTTDDFRFRITIGDEEHVLGPVASVTIPAGQPHASNVESGSGYLIVLKVPLAT
jgi:hypothetical protein